MADMDLLPPPLVFSLQTVRCPNCEHGIDPHGLDPGGACGVGNKRGQACSCTWSPNDIAGYLMANQERPGRTSGWRRSRRRRLWR